MPQTTSSAHPESPSPRRRGLRVVGLAATFLGLGSVALAAGWSSFDEAFPGLPCSDGWAACIVDGTVVSPGMVLDKGQRPHPGHMRAGFFDLDPLPGFSPFVGLSPYDGEAAEPEAVASSGGRSDGSGGSGGGARPEPSSGRDGSSGDAVADGGLGEPQGGDPELEIIEDDRPASGGLATNAVQGSQGSQGSDPLSGDPSSGGTQLSGSGTGSQAGTGTGGSSMNPNRPDPGNIVLATEPAGSGSGTSSATSSGTTSSGTASSSGTKTQPETTASTTKSEPAVADASTSSAPPPPPPPAAEPEGCDDLVALEAPAMMGQLGVSRRKCIEGRLSSASQTTKNKLSRVLIIDAEARGDRADWERLMKRHLEDIDRSDPDLCFKYAIHLSRGGAGRAHGVIRWADYALENKQQWSGNTYKKRVYALYKLRAQAANKLWESAEKKYVEERNDANEGKVAKYRGLTKDYSREWLDYARASSQDQKAPLALCVSSSGSTEFCSG